MIDTLLTWQFWTVFLLLMWVIWIKVRITRQEYYLLGTRQGFALGISRTVKTLVDEHMISKDAFEASDLDVDKLVDKIAPIIAANLVKEANRKAVS